MDKNRFKNQRLLINDDKLAGLRFVVIGAGAIGSSFVIALSKMGARKITVYDFDNLEDHNLANQLYPKSQLGKPKVEALKQYAADFGDCEITAINEPWTPDNAIEADVVVSCVDNMAVRKALFEFYVRPFHCLGASGSGGIAYFNAPLLFVDGRMGALVYRAFAVDMASKESVTHYKETLHTQEQGSKERCGQKSIIYTVYGVASMMCDLVKQWIMESDNRPTEIQYDYVNHQVTKVQHMEPVLEVMEYIEENDNGTGSDAGNGESDGKGSEEVLSVPS